MKLATKQLATEPVAGRAPSSPVKRDTRSLGEQVTPVTHRTRDSGFSGTVLEQTSTTPTAAADTDTSESSNDETVSPISEKASVGKAKGRNFDPIPEAIDPVTERQFEDLIQVAEVSLEAQFEREGITPETESDNSSTLELTGHAEENNGDTASDDTLGEEEITDKEAGNGNHDDQGEDDNDQSAKNNLENPVESDTESDEEFDDTMAAKDKIQDPQSFVVVHTRTSLTG